MNIFENFKRLTAGSKPLIAISSKEKKSNGIFFIESEHGIENNLACNNSLNESEILLQKFLPRYSYNDSLKNTTNLTMAIECGETCLEKEPLHKNPKLEKENEYLLKLNKFQETKAYLSNINPYFSGKNPFGDGLTDMTHSLNLSSNVPLIHCGESQDVGTLNLEYEVTHRGIFRFIPRHSDELEIDRGDPIYVQQQSSDLWGEGINLRTGECGIFPLAYVILDEDKCANSDNDLKTDRFLMNYLGSVEVDYHKGNHVICQAMSKICLLRKMCSTCSIPICIIEIGSQGIRILCKNSQNLRYNIPHKYYFPFYNISFCGYNPKDPRYFGYITKHPIEDKYACHVFLASAPTQLVVESIGLHFKEFYANIMQCMKFNTIVEGIVEGE